MRTKIFWKQRIIEYISANTRGMVITIDSPNTIEQQFRGHLDANFSLAYNELLDEDILIEHIIGHLKYHILDTDNKKDKIRYYLRLTDEDIISPLLTPSDEELKGLTLVFDSVSERKLPNQGIYYYCRKNDDVSFWVVLIKHTPITKAMRVILGSFTDDSSRISRIKRAMILAAKLSDDGKFVRKNAEDLDQKACGNNRIPSKCAFDIFVHEDILEVAGQKGLSKIYEQKKIRPKTD